MTVRHIFYFGSGDRISRNLIRTGGRSDLLQVLSVAIRPEQNLFNLQTDIGCNMSRFLFLLNFEFPWINAAIQIQFRETTE